MARGGLSVAECREILEAWRRRGFDIDDKVLERLAMDFRLVAPSDIDPNEIADFLALSGKKIAVSRAFNGRLSLESSFLELFEEAGLQDQLFSNIEGVLLIVTFSSSILGDYWGLPIVTMFNKLRSILPEHAMHLTGIYERYDDMRTLDLMMVVSVR